MYEGNTRNDNDLEPVERFPDGDRVLDPRSIEVEPPVGHGHPVEHGRPPRDGARGNDVLVEAFGAAEGAEGDDLHVPVEVLVREVGGLDVEVDDGEHLGALFRVNLVLSSRI